jgi:thiol:disulfide interchange protein
MRIQAFYLFAMLTLASASFPALLQASQAEAGAKAITSTLPGPAWSDDFDASLAKAKAEGKRVLVNFTGSDWCPWCIRMEEESLSKKAFLDYADKHLVLVFVDFPRDMSSKLPEKVIRQNATLLKKYNPQGFPSFIVLGPDGAEVDRREGYVQGGPDNFIYFLKVTESQEHLAK